MLVFCVDNLRILKMGFWSPIILLFCVYFSTWVYNNCFVCFSVLILRTYLWILYPVDKLTLSTLYNIFLCLFYRCWLKKKTFAWISYRYPWFLLDSIFFLSLNFVCMCALCSEVSLLWAAYHWSCVCLFYFLTLNREFYNLNLFILIRG